MSGGPSAAITAGAARVALVGANGHGQSHRRGIAELARTGSVTLVALGDVAPVPDAEPGVPVFTDHRALLAATAPDVVIVCTPPHTHLAIAEDALRAGADVLLEKPPVLDSTEHDRLSSVIAGTGRACQVGFQALGSPALAEVLSIVDGGGLGTLRSIAAVGAWKRDESYFGRSAWVGRADLMGSRVLDGALANPFAHAVMQVLAIAREEPRRIEVERYRAHEIQVDDTAALRLTFDSGLQALVAVTLCAEDFVAGEITVSGTAATAVLEYPTDRLRGPADPALRAVPGRIGLLENLVAHRRDSTVALVAPLSRTLPFTHVLESVTAAPVRAIDHRFLRGVDDLPRPRQVISGINELLRHAAASLALFSELSVPWALPVGAGAPNGERNTP